MAKNQWIIEDAPAQQQAPETFGQQLGRVGTATGLSALKGIEALASFIPETLLGRQAPHPKPSEIIKESAGLTPEYLEPKNLPERYAQKLAEFGPASLLTGGLSGLGRTALGSGVASALGEVGASEGLQDVAQLGTELASGRFMGKTPKIPSIKQAQKTQYDLAKGALKPTSKANASAIQNAVLNVEKELGTEVSKKYAEKIKHTLSKIEENITKENISPAKAMDLRKKLYKLGNEVPANVAADYLKPLTKGINDYFAVYAAENPEFYKHLKAADKLTELRNMNLYVSNLLDKAQLSKIPGGQIASDMLNYIAGEGERFARGIVKNPEARKYYFDAVKSVAKDNPGLAIKNLNKLRAEMPEVEQYKPKSEWIIED